MHSVASTVARGLHSVAVLSPFLFNIMKNPSSKEGRVM